MKDTDWEILYELYKNPNLTKVANLLYMTQPSLTKRLQNMESELQVAIVNRTPKGLTFTKEGEYLAEQAKKHLDFMKETKVALASFKEQTTNTIVIGSAYTYSKYTLGDILADYSRNHAHTHFDVINEQSNLLFRKVLEGSVDVGFIRGDYEGPVRQVLVDKNQAFLVSKTPLDLKELPKLQRIGYKTNDKTKELLDSWWEGHFGKTDTAEMSVGYIDFAWQLINKGLGYACCFLPDDFKNEYDLCLTPLSYADGRRVIRNTWFVYSKNKRQPKALEDFISYIEKYVAIE